MDVVWWLVVPVTNESTQQLFCVRTTRSACVEILQQSSLWHVSAWRTCLCLDSFIVVKRWKKGEYSRPWINQQFVCVRITLISWKERNSVNNRPFDKRVYQLLTTLLMWKAESNVSSRPCDKGASPSAARLCQIKTPFFMVLKEHTLKIILIYEHLLSASSRDEPWALYNGNYIGVLADPLCSSCMRLWMSDCMYTIVTECNTVRFQNSSKWLQRCLVITWPVPRKTLMGQYYFMK